MGQRRTDFLKVGDGFRILAFRNVLDSQEVDLLRLNQSDDIWIDILLCFGFAPQMKISRVNLTCMQVPRRSEINCVFSCSRRNSVDISHLMSIH